MKEILIPIVILSPFLLGCLFWLLHYLLPVKWFCKVTKAHPQSYVRRVDGECTCKRCGKSDLWTDLAVYGCYYEKREKR